MASPNNDTYIGSLDTLLRQVALMKTLADANLPFVIQLETAILDERRSPERQAQAAGIIPPQGQNPQGNAQLGLPGAPPMGGGGMSAPPPSFMGAGAPPGVQMSAGGPQSPADMAQFMGP